MKDPHEVILRPRITERTAALSYGDENQARQRLLNAARKESKRTGKIVQPDSVSDHDLIRKYTFEVATDANKIEIKAAVEAIYNAGRKRDDAITVTNVRTIKVLGKKKRRGVRTTGYQPDRKKAIVTLAAGQILEDYGV
ncbi:MAG TPA: 50S ribosomal protein L23 [Fimbriimonadaceae bacterium]|nr:50S ribosomal protein L23 [Fimbriimonadaceae bacterium]